MKKEFHHVGIPTARKQPDEIYLESVQLHITDAGRHPHHVEWVRAEEGCPFPEVMKTTAHVAYTVDNLDEALKGQQVIWPPFEPMAGVRVAFILDQGAPVEFLEFAK
jgi:hypothetical protein